LNRHRLAVCTHTHQRHTLHVKHRNQTRMLHNKDFIWVLYSQQQRILGGQGLLTLDCPASQRRRAGAQSGHCHRDTAPCAIAQHAVSACLCLCLCLHARVMLAWYIPICMACTCTCKALSRCTGPKNKPWQSRHETATDAAL